MLPRPYLVGLVGAGVGPSLSPAIHMLEARDLGLDYVYRIVDPDGLGRAAVGDRDGAALCRHARL